MLWDKFICELAIDSYPVPYRGDTRHDHINLALIKSQSLHHLSKKILFFIKNSILSKNSIQPYHKLRSCQAILQRTHPSLFSSQSLHQYNVFFHKSRHVLFITRKHTVPLSTSILFMRVSTCLSTDFVV